MTNTNFKVSYSSEGCFVDGYAIPGDAVSNALWYSPGAVRFEGGSISFGRSLCRVSVAGKHYEFDGTWFNQYGEHTA